VGHLPASLERKIGRLVGTCVEDFRLIAEGDRVLVGFSGGKDSWVLLHFMERMQRVAPVRFTWAVFHLNQSQPDFPAAEALETLRGRGYEVHVEHQDTASILAEKLEPGHSPCSLCSRLRRGILYTQAQRLGANKIALGHHREDAIETLLLNLFYAGQIKAMPAYLDADDGRNTVIRPLLYVPESLLITAARLLEVEIVDRNFCGQGPERKRAAIKAWLAQLEADNPKVKGNLLGALQRVVPSHLLDPKLWPVPGPGSSGVG